MNILFVSSEVYPFSKTGGLGDVSAGLPAALKQLGHDVKVLTPGYKFALEKAKDLKLRLRKFEFSGFRLLRGSIPGTRTPIFFLDMPELYYRNGTPYGTELSTDWPDNAERFDALTDVAIDMATDALNFDWKADIVHCNDWQTGLIPAKLSQFNTRPATLFTIHNMAYLGLFSHTVFKHLQLPEQWWDWNQLEFHNQFSFLKAGILHADQINTVSPSYAEQIKSFEHGYGLEGLLNARAERLSGILNGIDDKEWNPKTDKLIAANYSADNLENKAHNKSKLQSIAGLPESPNTPLIGMIGRMVEQKGYDLVASVIPQLIDRDVQFVILGSGNKTIEQQFISLQQRFPSKVSVRVSYDEAFAHQIEAGADMFLMPSRFEPCGLNQMYSLRYATIPIVHDTGGLSDSVVDVNISTLSEQTATGFKFYAPNDEQLLDALVRALDCYTDRATWQQIQLNGMQTDTSWSNSAQKYLSTYQKAIECQGDTSPNKSV